MKALVNIDTLAPDQKQMALTRLLGKFLQLLNTSS